MANCNIKTSDELAEYLNDLLMKTASSFGLKLHGELLTTKFENLIADVAQQGSVVILLDEYDKPILNNIVSPQANEILQVLKGFYSNIKKAEKYLRFVFVTGVSKFCHVSIFSEVNKISRSKWSTYLPGFAFRDFCKPNATHEKIKNSASFGQSRKFSQCIFL